MTRWIGATIPLLIVVFGSSVAIVTATPVQAVTQTSAAGIPADVSARHLRRHTRHTRHTRHAYRPHDQLTYYDRPYNYEPAPFVPFNYGYVFWPRIFWWP
jgi:hypothetical protein